MADLLKRIQLKPSQAIIAEYEAARTEGTKDEPIKLSLSPLFVMKGTGARAVKTILVDDEGKEVAALLKVTDVSPDMTTLKLNLVEKVKDGVMYTFYTVGNSIGECEVVGV